jgi:hypothetical protein
MPALPTNKGGNRGGKVGPMAYTPSDFAAAQHRTLNNKKYVQALLSGDKDAANFEFDRGQRNDPHLQDGELQQRRISNAEGQTIIRKFQKVRNFHYW